MNPVLVVLCLVISLVAGAAVAQVRRRNPTRREVLIALAIVVATGGAAVVVVVPNRKRIPTPIATPAPPPHEARPDMAPACPAPEHGTRLVDRSDVQATHGTLKVADLDERTEDDACAPDTVCR